MSFVSLKTFFFIYSSGVYIKSTSKLGHCLQFNWPKFDRLYCRKCWNTIWRYKQFRWQAENIYIEITIKNTGNLTIAYNNWEIYFYAIRLVQPNEYPYKEGFKLHNCKMRLYHVAGSLCKLCPERNFRMESHDFVECKLVMKYWQSAKTDTMPNWYVWAEGLTSRDIESTQGDTLTFVGPFERPEQYQRYADDGWSPFTPESR